MTPSRNTEGTRTEQFETNQFDKGVVRKELATENGLRGESTGAVAKELDALTDLEIQEAKLRLFQEFADKYRKFKSLIEGLEPKIAELQKMGVKQSDRNKRTLPDEFLKAAVILQGALKKGSLYTTDADPLKGIDRAGLERLVGTISKELEEGGLIQTRESRLKDEKIAEAHTLKAEAARFQRENADLITEVAAKVREATSAAGKKAADELIRSKTPNTTLGGMMTTQSRNDGEKTVFDDLIKMVEKYHATLENFDSDVENTKNIDINASLQSATGIAEDFLPDDLNAILSYILYRRIDKDAANAMSQGISIDRSATKTTDIAADKKYSEGILKEIKNIIALIDSRGEVAELKQIVEVYNIQDTFFPSSDDSNEQVLPKSKAISAKLATTKTAIEQAKTALALAVNSAEKFHLKVGGIGMDLRKALAIVLALGLAATAGRFTAPEGLSEEEAKAAFEATKAGYVNQGKRSGNKATLAALAKELNISIPAGTKPTVDSIATAINTRIDAAAADGKAENSLEAAKTSFTDLIALSIVNSAYPDNNAAFRAAGLDTSTTDLGTLTEEQLKTAEETLIQDLIRRATALDRNAPAIRNAFLVLKSILDLPDASKIIITATLDAEGESEAADIIKRP